ncbi:MAG TPA: PIN domain-containing protein [Chitinophagaceae bacterium]|nr:PIN domain-containing protein [Chitinophagaceae bacterium]
MIYLVLDTNNWIYLANGLDPISNKHHDNLHFELLQSLIDLTNDKKVQVLVNDIILQEWDRNKMHCYTKIKTLEHKLANKENTFKDIEKYSKSDVLKLQKEYSEGLESEIQRNKEHIQKVEDFLRNNCITTEITNDLKVLIFELSVKNEAPFHNNKNNSGDAAILLASVNYLKQIESSWNNSAFFISNNIEEFTDGKELNDFHPHIKTLIAPVNIKFQRVLPRALNISKQVIAQMEEFILELANFAVEQFRWDIAKRENGTLMFLDVQYFNNKTQQEDFLTLTVAKDNGKERPRFISFILPNNLSKENGVFLFFVNNKIDEESKEFKIEPDDKSTIRLHFEDISKETCTARIWNGYAKMEEGGIVINVFQKLLEFDSFFVMYFNEDLTQQSISVPLYSFKQQYALLPD